MDPISLPPSKDKKPPKKPINVSLKTTKYAVVKQVTLEIFKWRSVLSEDWDLTWSDFYISEDFIRKLAPHQKINHFPGSYLLCKKNFLASHLLKLQQNLPEAYDFFPKTWILPFNYKNLLEHAESNNHKKVFIAKPEASCQGRGIFLTKKVFKTLNERENYVVQEYLKNPLLIDGFKFDLRLYVLVKNVDPLKIFLFRDGLARFATEKFQKPRNKNFMNLFMHLTNYSINKKNSNFQQNSMENGEETGHKRSFLGILEKLAKEGKNVSLLQRSIDDLIIKTICSVQPYLSHLYRTNRPKEQDPEMCFEILGFDIILDQNLKPWLLEVNHTPSFSTDSDLDYRIKFNLIKDSLKLVNVKRKNSKQKKITEIIEYEDRHLGNFRRIYPTLDTSPYETYMASAKEIWDLWSQGKKVLSKPNRSSIKVDPPAIRRKHIVRPISAVVPNLPLRPNYLKTNIQTVAVNSGQNNANSTPHAPQNMFPAKNKQFLRPRSAFNVPYKCEECKREEEADDNSKNGDKDLRMVKDFLKPKSGLIQDHNFTDLLKNHVLEKKTVLATTRPTSNNNSFPSQNAINLNNSKNGNYVNSLGSAHDFEDKKLQTMVLQKIQQFPSEKLFLNLTKNLAKKPTIAFTINQNNEINVNKKLRYLNQKSLH